MRLAVFLAAASATLVVHGAPAAAQSNRTFVSGHGSDSNPCSIAAPCRSFAQANTLTNAGGEITVLDPAGYGPVNITKALSIVNDGVGEAGVTVTTGTDAIDINAGASDVINLIGLTLVGGGVGTNGIVFNTGLTLNIQNCVIRGFARDGIDFYGTATSGNTVSLSIADTIVSNNGVAQGGSGIVVVPSGAGTAAVSLNRVQAVGNTVIGLLVQGGGGSGAAYTTIADSAAVANQTGFQSEAGAGSMTSVMTIDNSQAINNVGANQSGFGVLAVGPGATLMFGRSTVSGNTTGWGVLGIANRFGMPEGNGIVQSFGDNYINGNVNDGGKPPLISKG